MTKWDYILVENATIDQITAMGRRGWELCSVRNSLADSTIYFYLKRPLPPTKADLGEPRFNW